MAITPVPPLTDIPTFPALSDRAAGDYNGMAFAFARHMSDKFVQEIVPVATSAVSNATDAQASALLATQARDQTQADRVATGQDRTATAADRVQTNLDKLAAQAAAAQAGNAGAFTDTNPIVKNASDNTRQWRVTTGNLPTGTQRTNPAPDNDAQLATLANIPAAVPAGLVPLATIFPAAGQAAIDFATVFNSPYDNYLITGVRVGSANGNASAMLCARAIENGTPITTANYITASLDGIAPTENTQLVNLMTIGPGPQTGFEIQVSRFIGDAFFFFESTGRRFNQNTSGIMQGRYLNRAVGSSKISGIRFFWSDGVNFTANGVIRIYGIARA